MKLFRVAGFLAAALALGLSPACGPDNSTQGNGPPGTNPPGTNPPNPDQTDRPKVAFVTNNPESFWTIAQAGADKAAQEANVELLFQRPKIGDLATQRATIDGVVDQGVKAIAVSVIDPVNQAQYIDKIAADTPFLCVDNDAPNTKRLCYIGTDNYEAGRAVGRLVKEAMPGGGKIAVFVGNLESDNARNRRKGVIDELNGSAVDKVEDGKTYGDYQLVRTYTEPQVGRETAKRNALAALDSDELKDAPNVCLIGLWAYNPPTILNAVRDREKLGKVKIVGFDEDEETLKGIADGYIAGTVVQNPYEFGSQSVKMMAAIVKGDRSGIPADGRRWIEFRIITKDGGKKYPGAVHGQETSIPVKDFTEQLHKLLGKS